MTVNEDYINCIFNEDCKIGLDRIPDKSIDLIMMDPPYEFNRGHGGGTFGTDNRKYHGELDPLSHGIDQELLDKIVSKMKKINIYIWCNKEQIHQYLNYFSKKTGGGTYYNGPYNMA